MKPRWFRPWWLLFLIPLALGLARLRFDTEVLDLLPMNVPSVEGVKIYQQKFSNSRELLITLTATNRESASAAAQAIAERLKTDTNLVADVIWRPPWLEHPEQTAELIAHLWFNGNPAAFTALADRLAATNLVSVLTETRDELATTMSPTEIARLSYDPFGLTRLPESVSNAAQGFGQGEELFASSDGTFRLLFVKSSTDLAGYRECTAWLDVVKRMAHEAAGESVALGFTGRPAFVAEISASMKRDIIISVVGTSVIIAILFWLAHRRIKPMLWLLTLLALILAATLALGGLVFGTINVVSMGFAAVLLGLAVDYAVVHYQEALAHPDLSVPQVRRAIAPSIFWAAATTISAFFVLNFGGLPGLAQLGSLVALGVAISAFVMIFAFLPPLFPERMHKVADKSTAAEIPHTASAGVSRKRFVFAYALTGVLLIGGPLILLTGFPKLDASAKALEPRNSQAYAALEAIKKNLNESRDPLWIIVGGPTEQVVAQRLDALSPILEQAVSNQTLGSFTVPVALWPHPENQSANRTAALRLVTEREALRNAALTNGFSEDALGLTRSVLDTWQHAASSSAVFWPTNPLVTWIFEKLAVRETTNFYAVGFLFPPTNGLNLKAIRQMDAQLPREGTWLAGWGLLGAAMLDVVQRNLWKLVVPMVGLVLLSLWLAFRRAREIALSIAVLLLSGLILLAVMRLAGWSWNLLNLMAMPLILGTGVDYSIFTQLALRRHAGDLRITYLSVGRALLLCGGTAIAGFGTLGLSSNAGMASLGQVCAVGIAANMLLAVFVLPVWWRTFAGGDDSLNGNGSSPPSKPSSLYSAKLWGLGLCVVRVLPPFLMKMLARIGAAIYWRLSPERRAVVVDNLKPVFNGDSRAATCAARKLFTEFALKVVDLWRYEAGSNVMGLKTNWQGWENFEKPHARGRGVLIVTPHFGNWELGATFFVSHNVPLLVLTQAEPDAALTEMRQASRARRGIETFVVGTDPFAFIEIIKRLQAGAAVALLVDRPPQPTAVNVEFLGHTLPASIAAAELARASGCAIVPGVILRQGRGYSATILPEIPYDRATITNREARARLTQQIIRAFEPAIRKDPDQWYHFVPIWAKDKTEQRTNGANNSHDS